MMFIMFCVKLYDRLTPIFNPILKLFNRIVIIIILIKQVEMHKYRITKHRNHK